MLILVWIQTGLGQSKYKEDIADFTYWQKKSVKSSVTSDNFIINLKYSMKNSPFSLIYKIAEWETKDWNSQLISFLNCLIDLTFLISGSKEFYNNAPLQLKLHFK